jgi:hypothetical protein
VDRVYFFDLLGAAVGCLALVTLLNYFGGPNTVLAAGVLFAVSAAIWYNLASTLRGRVAAVVLALSFVVLIIYNVKHRVIDIQFAKGGALPAEMFVQWNSFSRIGLVHDADVYDIRIDADASTAIATYDLGNLTAQQKFDLQHYGPGIPYMLRPGAKTLIIGPGGGWDVARALRPSSQPSSSREPSSPSSEPPSLPPPSSRALSWPALSWQALSWPVLISPPSSPVSSAGELQRQGPEPAARVWHALALAAASDPLRLHPRFHIRRPRTGHQDALLRTQNRPDRPQRIDTFLA